MVVPIRSTWLISRQARTGPGRGRKGVQRGGSAPRAWERWRADLADLAGITDVLTDVEQRADELNRRAAALLDNRP